MVGPLGAAVAASHVLGLDAAQLAHALGIRASRAGELTANARDNDQVDPLRPGRDAGAGGRDALAAAAKPSTPKRSRAPQGYVHAFFTPEFQPRDLLNLRPAVPARMIQAT